MMTTTTMATLRLSVVVWTLVLLLYIPFCQASSSSSSLDFDFPDRQNITRISFGSCHKNKYGRADLWPRVFANDPQVWLWTGDSIYPPLRKVASVDLLQREYHQMKTNATLGYGAQLAAHPNTLVFGAWDDHDAGGNDAGVELDHKMERAKAFFDFLDYPKEKYNEKNEKNEQQQQRQGTYHSVTLGQPPQQIKILLLDTRWHRDKHCIPSVATYVPLGAGLACLTRWLSAGLLHRYCRAQAQHKTVLGKEQWQWLESELKDSQAPVHIVVSSIQVLTTNPAMESWSHFPQERQRLLRLLSQTPGALVLSGDVHHGEILDPSAHFVDNNGKNTFLEVTSSGLTHTCQKGLYGFVCQPLLQTFSKHRGTGEFRHAYYLGRNFGRIAVDWVNRTVTVTIHDAETGHEVLSTGTRSMQQYHKWTPDELNGIVDAMNGHLVPVAVGVAAVLVVVVWQFQRRKR